MTMDLRNAIAATIRRVDEDHKLGAASLACEIVDELEMSADLLAVGLRSFFNDHALGLIAIEVRTKGPAAGPFWQDLAAACERAAGV